jgi:carbonic anhydrase
MAMEKVFHFDSPREIYKADACVITCFDARFDLAVRKFLKRRGVVTFDHVKIPGGVKSLAAPECDTDRDFVLRMVRTSMRLHGSERVLVVAHGECGAYPGAPMDVVTADAVRAAEFLRASEPPLAVECYFADFDGVYVIG